jgi:hypothetical protein
MLAAEDLDPRLEVFERQFRCDVALALALSLAEPPPTRDETDAPAEPRRLDG